MNIPSRVQIIDVGPRDGLQNEKQTVPAEVKIELVHRLQAAGLTEIEVTSFVSPKWVPQMADNAVVMAGIERQAGVRYSVLTPNMVGYQAAVASRPDEIVVFGAASQAFSQKNINCSIEESMERFAPVVQAALANHWSPQAFAVKRALCFHAPGEPRAKGGIRKVPPFLFGPAFFLGARAPL